MYCDRFLHTRARPARLAPYLLEAVFHHVRRLRTVHDLPHASRFPTCCTCTNIVLHSSSQALHPRPSLFHISFTCTNTALHSFSQALAASQHRAARARRIARLKAVFVQAAPGRGGAALFESLPTVAGLADLLDDDKVSCLSCYYMYVAMYD